MVLQCWGIFLFSGYSLAPKQCNRQWLSPLIHKGFGLLFYMIEPMVYSGETWGLQNWTPDSKIYRLDNTNLYHKHYNNNPQQYNSIFIHQNQIIISHFYYQNKVPKQYNSILKNILSLIFSSFSFITIIIMFIVCSFCRWVSGNQTSCQSAHLSIILCSFMSLMCQLVLISMLAKENHLFSFAH